MGFWKPLAIGLLGIVALGVVGGIAYNVGVDHGTTVQLADGETVRYWRDGWGPRGNGGFFPFFPILFFLFIGLLFFTLVRVAVGPRRGWGGPPPWVGGTEARTERFDDWHRRSHERIERTSNAPSRSEPSEGGPPERGNSDASGDRPAGD